MCSMGYNRAKLFMNFKKVTLTIVIALLALLVITPCSFAQTQKEIAKEHKQVAKLSKSELSAKATKAARQEAKKYKKDGWLVTPGALPIEKQLDRAYMMQYEYEENAMPKYMMGEAMSIGENYDAAKIQAIEFAKQNLAGQLETRVTAIIKNSVANKQLAAEQAASIVKTVSASKNMISKRLGQTIPIVEMYRIKKNKNKEVLVRIAYNSKMAEEAAKTVIREELEKENGDLHQQLDKVWGMQ